jgi:mannose-6-phosphate isomerase-like protein (cupin superfamily)
MARPSPQARAAVVPVGTRIDIGDHSVEILATPADTGDRYRLRIVAQPGGGPGIDGDDPHVHPTLVETFVCMAGSMRALVGSRLVDLEPGQRIEVPARTPHGFINSGDTPLEVESEVIFLPPGYRADADLMGFAAAYDRLRAAPSVDPRTGEPPMLQMAVLTDAYRSAVLPAGMAGALIRPLAVIGRMRGYRSEGRAARTAQAGRPPRSAG